MLSNMRSHKDQNIIDAVRISYFINKQDLNPSKWQLQDGATLKGQIPLKIENLYSPQDISGASQRDSTAAFYETTDVDGDVF